MSSLIDRLKNNNFIFILYFYLIFSMIIVSFNESCDACTGKLRWRKGVQGGAKEHIKPEVAREAPVQHD